jgi:hypothetical protein
VSWNRRLSVLLSLIVAGGALSHGGCDKKADARKADDKKPVEQPQPRSSTVTVQEAPREAAYRIAGALKDEFGFTVGNKPSELREPADAVEGDYFMANLTAYTKAGLKVQVSCRWVAENRSVVTVTSELPQDHQDHLAQEIGKWFPALR